MRPISKAFCGVNGWPKRNERKGEAREGVFAEVGHDGRGGEAVGHFGGRQREVGVGDERGQSVTMARPMPKPKASPWTFGDGD